MPETRKKADPSPPSRSPRLGGAATTPDGSAPLRRRCAAPHAAAESPPAADPSSEITEPGHLSDADLDPADFGASVVDLAALDAAIQASGYDGSVEALSVAEEQRVRLLLRYRDDPTLHKPILIATPDMIERLMVLGRAQPNFEAVTTLVAQAMQLSVTTGHPLRLPPLLLVGPPGTGKSRYMRALAAVLDTTFEAVDGAAIPDAGSLVGYPPVWKGSGPGYVARTLVRASTFAPLILVDEIEKISDPDHNPHPENKLLALLEPHTASVWQDEFVRVPMRADGVFWVFMANDATTLSAPFLDRVVTLRIPALPRAARDAVLEAMLAEVADASGASVTLEHRDALGPVRSLGLRRARLAFGLAVAAAVSAQRNVVLRRDLAQAAGLLRQHRSAPQVVADRLPLRAPPGFIDHRARRRAQRNAGGSQVIGRAQ